MTNQPGLLTVAPSTALLAILPCHPPLLVDFSYPLVASARSRSRQTVATSSQHISRHFLLPAVACAALTAVFGRQDIVCACALVFDNLWPNCPVFLTTTRSLRNSVLSAALLQVGYSSNKGPPPTPCYSHIRVRRGAISTRSALWTIQTSS